jgi:hypothetical protein
MVIQQREICNPLGLSLAQHTFLGTQKLGFMWLSWSDDTGAGGLMPQFVMTPTIQTHCFLQWGQAPVSTLETGKWLHSGGLLPLDTNNWLHLWVITGVGGSSCNTLIHQM